MNRERSGEIYSLDLDFDLGKVYIELLDFTDISDFDGVLIQVYDCLPMDNDDKPIFGPVPIQDYPVIRGKYAWKFIEKRVPSMEVSPYFKSLQALI